MFRQPDSRPATPVVPFTAVGSNVCLAVCLGVCLAALAAHPAAAVTPPSVPSPAADRQMRSPELAIRNVYPQLDELPAGVAASARGRLAALGVAEDRARLDPRSGRWGMLLLAEPLLPKRGAGTPMPQGQLEAFAWEAFTGWLGEHREALGIDPAEVGPGHRVTLHDGGGLVQIYAPRTVGGLPVRDSWITAAIRHGRLVLFGAHQWGDLTPPSQPALPLEDAWAAARAYLDPLAVTGSRRQAELLFVPTATAASDGAGADAAPAGGYRYRLVWALEPRLQGLSEEDGRWELLVDAQSGEVLAFEDTLDYAAPRRVVGGVYPLSNDGTPPGGAETAGWPMPHDTVTGAAGSFTTDDGGNLALCVDGDLTSKLSGPFVRIQDFCGAVSLTSSGDLDFGTGPGTDCATPGFGGAGNTHASRSTFHHLDRVREQARGQLPANPWLTSRLTAQVNVSSACTAAWDGKVVSYFCSAPGCANTGELTGVIAHEWGHGMDDNDAFPTISNPGEGVADLYAFLQTGDSCIGPGFRLGTNCGGYGDPCTACDGVRQIDFAGRASGLPHDVAWIDANCPLGSKNGPCGGSTHCEGAVYAEAVYDLIHRDLPTLFGTDAATALELGTRLTYLGGGAVGDWFQCTTPFGGCNADGGYLNLLVADDDNGDLSDGTPHMSAIFAAFNRHGIACDVPAVTDSGCAGTPAAAPVVTATPRDRAVELSWSAVAGATGYQVLRSEGVTPCGLGKTRVGETAGTTFTDSGLQNGRTYAYTVIPVGAAGSCLGPASVCTEVTPAPGANLAIDPASEVVSIRSVADGDEFLDNCELARLSFEVANTGTGSLTNVRIASVTSPSHPGTQVVTSLPAAAIPSTLAECETAAASFDFIAQGLAQGDTLELVVEVTADELPAPRTATFTFDRTEADFQSVASRTFGYETDLEDWRVVQGTFDRSGAGGGALGTAFYLASSQGLPNQCDHLRSPRLRLTAASTLEIHTQFDIEGLCDFPLCLPPTWFDRANVGVFEEATGARTLIVPDGGRLYNASGPFGSCGTAGQSGWAGTQINWGPSTWSPTALRAAVLAGRTVQLDVRYGTDEAVQGQGFQLDEVTLTDFEIEAADGQSDVCTPQCATAADCDDGLFCNGAETCLAGVCVVGDLPCDDGVACTADVCDEATSTCTNTPDDARCSNGLFCDGAETCDPLLDCQPGTPVDCDDGVACTADACSEALAGCSNVPDDAACSNGVFCDGAETCDPALGCQPAAPVDCGDGVACTVDVCNETDDRCDHTADDSLCDNGLFCDGAETCDPLLDCQSGEEPCFPIGCDDTTDACTGTPTAQLEAGTVTVGATPVTVHLTHAYVQPVIVATARYNNGINRTGPVVPRISHITPIRFDLRLQNPSGGAVTAETVSWLVVEAGSWVIDGVPLEAQRTLSTVTDENNSWTGEAQVYLGSFTNPVVVGQVMTSNDPDWSAFWAGGDTRFEPPSATALRTGKMVGEDTDVTRADETVGFVVFEQGHGTIAGVEMDAAVGSDKIQGVDNPPVPDFYNFLTPFPVAPKVALMTLAGVQDSDGGWAQGYGGLLSSAVNLFLVVDEDQISDAERSHTTEKVAYVAFANPVIYPEPTCFADAECDDGAFCNGTETCFLGACQPGADPCPGQGCDEAGDVCLPAMIFTSGLETGDMSEWSESVP